MPVSAMRTFHTCRSTRHGRKARDCTGAVSIAHEHTSDEFFLVLKGELTDHDGTRYREGDMVLLRKGTQHSAHTEHGCTLLVFNDTLERTLDKA